MEASLQAARTHRAGVRNSADLAERTNEIASRIVRVLDGRLASEEEVRRLAFTIGRRLMIDRIRAKARVFEHDGVLAERAIAPPRNDRPLNSTGHLSTHLARAIEVLPSELKGIIMQRVLQEMTTRQIAEGTGLSESTVRRRLEEAFRVLRCYLRKKSEQHPELIEELRALGLRPPEGSP